MPRTVGRIQFDPAPSLGSRQLVGPSLLRTAIYFFPPRADRCYLSSDPMALPDQGIPLLAGQTPLKITMEEYGEMPQRPWHILYQGASLAPIGWVEIFG